MNEPAPPYPEPLLKRLRLLTRVMDEAVPIPGTGFHVGLDSLLGFLPGIGDGLGAMASGYLVLCAHRLGAAPSVLLQMLLNVGIDSTLGAVPVAGDLFDIGFKANRRNLDLLEAHLQSPQGAQRRSSLVVGAFALGLLAFFVACFALVAGLVVFLVGLLRG